MAGEADRRPPVTPPAPEGLPARKIALVRVAVGVPMLAMSLFAFVVAYRVSGRPLGDRVFWLAILAVLAGFGIYFARPLRELLRKT